MKNVTRFLALCAIVLTISPFSARPVFQTLSAQQIDPVLDRIINDPQEFEMLSSAAQNLLRFRFGPKAGEAPGASLSETRPLDESPSDRQEALAQTEPDTGSRIRMALPNPIVNDAFGDSTSRDTQSETTLVFGSVSWQTGNQNLIAGYNDSGSFSFDSPNPPANKFTGYSRSFNDGGIWFEDQHFPADGSRNGTLRTNPNGDAGDPVLARDNSNGLLYFATLFFFGSGLNVFVSDDDAATWRPPLNAAPGTTGFQDKEWMAVDNAPGAGQGNVYVAWRSFSTAALSGIRFTRWVGISPGFEPSGGMLIAATGAFNVQGAAVTVGADHAVYVFWLDQSAGPGTPNIIRMRKSTDQGITFGMPITVAPLLTTGTNGSLGDVGGFRTNAFPMVATHPTNPNNLYLTYNDNPAGVDSGNVYFRQSNDGGMTWSSQVQVNTDTTTRLNWCPAIAVTPDGSRLGVFWYDRRRDPDDRLIERWGGIASVSGNSVTFGPNFRVSDEFPPAFGNDPVVNPVYMGDYDTAIANNSAFYTVWGDNRDDGVSPGATRKNPNVRFAKIPVAGPGPILSRQSVTIRGGDGDMLLEPNECLSLNVTIINDGTAPATGITAELTSFTPGANITHGVSNYPNLRPGATGTNSTPFQISMAPSFPCGVPVELKLALNYPGGSDTIYLTFAVTDYDITSSAGAAIVPGTTDIGNHGDDVTTLVALPFAYSLYGQTFATVRASSNGNLQFVSNNAAFANTCPLPTPMFNFAVLPHWDDLRTDLPGTGVFSSVSGSAPNRIFNIEWRTVYFDNPGQTANFEVRLYEGQERFDVIYGTIALGGSSATVGVQRDTGSRFTQFSCNMPASLSSGLQLAFQLAPCTSGPGVCPNSFTGPEQANLGLGALGANPLRLRARDFGSTRATLLRSPGRSPRK